MTTNKKPLRCGICGETSGKYTYRTGRFSSAQTIGPFTDQQALVGHKRFVHYEEYKAATAKARITREARQRAELEAAQKAKAHMETASVAKVAAWESGTPVTLEEVLAARAAGEKDANLR